MANFKSIKNYVALFIVSGNKAYCCTFGVVSAYHDILNTHTYNLVLFKVKW